MELTIETALGNIKVRINSEPFDTYGIVLIYTGWAVDFPGIVAQGLTINEVVSELQKAAEIYNEVGKYETNE